MRIAVFSTKNYDKDALNRANAAHHHDLEFFEPRLTPATATLAQGFAGVCAFVNDDLSRPVLASIAAAGVRLVTLRSAGFNHVDLAAADALGITIARVPAYSPHAVAEHAMGLILSLNRKYHRAYARVREGNFALDGLMGFDLYQKTIGVVGTGKIGRAFARIALGFGSTVVAHDIQRDAELEAAGVTYVSLEDLLKSSDVVALHLPLTPDSHHMINATTIAWMKPGAMLINTSRGALVDTRAVVAALKTGQIGALGLDVYEEEADLFFEDLSNNVLQDDVFARLLTFPNVLITGHQGFFTREAVDRIAQTTLANATAFETGKGEISVVNAVIGHAPA